MHPSLVFLVILGVYNLQTSLLVAAPVLGEEDSCSSLQNNPGIKNLDEESICTNISASEGIRILAPLNGSIVGKAATLAVRAEIGDLVESLTITINGLEWLETSTGKGDRLFRLPESLRQGWHYLIVTVTFKGDTTETAGTGQCASVFVKVDRMQERTGLRLLDISPSIRLISPPRVAVVAPTETENSLHLTRLLLEFEVRGVALGPGGGWVAVESGCALLNSNNDKSNRGAEVSTGELWAGQHSAVTLDIGRLLEEAGCTTEGAQLVTIKTWHWSAGKGTKAKAFGLRETKDVQVPPPLVQENVTICFEKRWHEGASIAVNGCDQPQSTPVHVRLHHPLSGSVFTANAVSAKKYTDGRVGQPALMENGEEQTTRCTRGEGVMAVVKAEAEGCVAGNWDGGIMRLAVNGSVLQHSVQARCSLKTNLPILTIGRHVRVLVDFIDCPWCRTNGETDTSRLERQMLRVEYCLPVPGRSGAWQVHAAAEVFVDVVAADAAAARDALGWDGVPAAAAGALVEFLHPPHGAVFALPPLGGPMTCDMDTWAPSGLEGCGVEETHTSASSASLDAAGMESVMLRISVSNVAVGWGGAGIDVRINGRRLGVWRCSEWELALPRCLLGVGTHYLAASLVTASGVELPPAALVGGSIVAFRIDRVRWPTLGVLPKDSSSFFAGQAWRLPSERVGWQVQTLDELLEAYAAFHAAALPTLGAESGPGVVLYTPPEYGWGNRMLDLAACLLLCLLTDRLLLVNWTSPSPLADLASPHGFDWLAAGQAPAFAVLSPCSHAVAQAALRR